MASILRRIEWKVFGALLAAGLLGVVAILPYLAEMIAGGTFGRVPTSDLPMPLIVALAIVQNGILLSVAIVVGMLVSERVGLRMPLVRAWAKGEPPGDPASAMLPGIAIGAAVGAALVAMDALLFIKHLPAAMLPVLDIALWKRLAAGVLYGGLTEEIFMRLFLMSLVAWLLGRWWKTPQGMPAPGAFWTAILVVAILFGLGHLPATSAIAPLTPLLISRALLLNGIAGIAFGWLYWKRGLEAAMVGHMSAHLVMQIPGAALLRSIA